MKRLAILITLSILLFFSCKKADIDAFDKTDTNTIKQMPQFTEFLAASSADNSKFYYSEIKIRKGETVTISYTLFDAEWLNFYENDKWFIRGPVQRVEKAAYMYPECQNSLVFKLEAKNRLGTVSKEMKIIVQ